MADPVVYKVTENLETHGRFVTGEEIAYTSYSGVDITATIILPFEPKPLHLGELQTISYSMHRENKPVRTLGHVNPRGFTRGSRLIAGSMIFIQFDSYAFYRLNQYKELVYPARKNGFVPSRIFPVADMLPPFDMILDFSNEYGSNSRMKIFGMTIIDEGGTFSIEDLVSEQTFTYIARGIQPLTAYVPQTTQASVNSGTLDSNVRVNVLGSFGGGTGGSSIRPLID